MPHSDLSYIFTIQTIHHERCEWCDRFKSDSVSAGRTARPSRGPRPFPESSSREERTGSSSWRPQRRRRPRRAAPKTPPLPSTKSLRRRASYFPARKPRSCRTYTFCHPIVFSLHSENKFYEFFSLLEIWVLCCRYAGFCYKVFIKRDLIHPSYYNPGCVFLFVWS